MRLNNWCLSAVVLAAPVFAEPVIFQLDPAQSQVAFTLDDVLHTVHGTFQLEKSVIRVDPATGSAGGSVVVDARSGNSGSNARDSRMHKKILESESFPQITFTPDRLLGQLNLQGASDFQLHGIFSIHGASHELSAKVHAEASDGKITATVGFPVPYVKWGMKNPSTLFLRVGDTVKIDLRITARIVPGT